MSGAKVGLDSEVRRKTSANDSDATPTGGAWEGLDSVTVGSQVGDLCFIPVGAEPGLGQKHQVDCDVNSALMTSPFITTSDARARN